jgi:hypothetical protein
MKLLYIFTLSIVLAGCVTAPSKNLSDFAVSASEDFGLPEYSKEDLQSQKFKTQAAFIFSILYYTTELNIHRMNGQTENQVFVHDQGGEAVYDKNGDLVTDCVNKGSFNYAHYKREPLEHFSIDILPWLRWGNCREDSTTINQRIEAYTLDFQAGFEIASSDTGGYFLPTDFDPSNPTLSVTLAFFLKAFESEGFELYDFIMNAQSNETECARFLKALKSGFKFHFEKV